MKNIFMKLIWFPTSKYMREVNSRNITKSCEICSKLALKIPSDVSEIVMVILLLTLNIFTSFSSVSFVDFE